MHELQKQSGLCNSLKTVPNIKKPKYQKGDNKYQVA
jgi:hypothetical protein